MRQLRTVRYCIKCKNLRTRGGGRNLCDRCHHRHRLAGTLDQFDLVTRPKEERLADWLKDVEAAGLKRATNSMLADYFKVTRRTVERWKSDARSLGLLE